MEVYLAARTFKSWEQTCAKLPMFIRNTIIDTGICHYMLIVVEPGESGAIRQYDFGPRGGDVSFLCPLTQKQQEHRPSTTEPSGERVEWRHASDEGEVRETLLDDLPNHLPLLLVGRAKEGLTTEAIRAFSQTRPLRYQLCERDCRHFTNDLYQFVCDKPDTIVTSTFIKAQFHAKIEKHRLPIIKQLIHKPIIDLVQDMTAQENWERTKRGLQTFQTSLTGAFWGIGLHFAVQPLHSAPMTAMAVAAVAASTSNFMSHSGSREGISALGDQQENSEETKAKRSREARGPVKGGLIGAAQAIGFGALTVASAAFTASMGTRALALPANAAIEVGRRVSRIASSPQALSTLNSLRKIVQRKDSTMRRVASAGALMLPSNGMGAFEPSSSREGRSRSAAVQFKARGGSPEGRALLFPSVGVGKEGSQAAGSPASSLPILSFSSSEGNGKMRRKGSDWSVSSREGVSRNRVLDSFGVHQKVKGHSCALRGVLMLSAPERSLKSITNVN